MFFSRKVHQNLVCNVIEIPVCLAENAREDILGLNQVELAAQVAMERSVTRATLNGCSFGVAPVARKRLLNYKFLKSLLDVCPLSVFIANVVVLLQAGKVEV